MQRRDFFKLSAAMAAAPLLQQCGNPGVVPGSIVGASSHIGHLVRGQQSFGEPSETIHRQVVIIGGGVSGLSAARHLWRQGITDLAVLDLEKNAGGNAAFGQNGVSAFPWGAHYVPTPNNDLPEYLQFLQECGVLTGYNKEGLPVYNEYHLCFDPQERLYLNGRWQEGLVPRYGVPPEEQRQIDLFLHQMEQFRYAKGSDGKAAFAIPTELSSADRQYTSLDKITMQQWLRQNGYTSPYLHWYVNYCTRDDFGTPHHKVSAWAGIHYFASRKGRGANAAPHDVLTWPEGNGWLVRHLAKGLKPALLTGAVALQVRRQANAVWIDCFDTHQKRLRRLVANQCILAVPQFVAARLLRDAGRQQMVQQHLHYTPWMVANLSVQNLDERSGAPRSWDNVLYGSEALGYVLATHQLPQQHVARHNLTYYLPLTAAEPPAARGKAQQTTHAQWAETVFSDLERVHPNIRQATRRLDVMIWGHAMAQPLPGVVHGTVRSTLGQSLGRNLHFAHTDLAGISIFEAAFYQGLRAAGRVLQYL